jgi:peptidoglycan hydrolase CwlO-like protein
MKEHRELQTLIDQLEAHIREQDEQIDSLQKSNKTLLDTCSKYAEELVRLRRAITDELSVTRAAQIFNGGSFKQRGVE